MDILTFEDRIRGLVAIYKSLRKDRDELVKQVVKLEADRDALASRVAALEAALREVRDVLHDPNEHNPRQRVYDLTADALQGPAPWEGLPEAAADYGNDVEDTL